MPSRRIWEVDFNVIGQVTISTDMSFRQEKGFDRHQFYSDIKLKKLTHGIRASITAYADTCEVAETVAYVYFGRMIDVLSFENNIPITVYTDSGGANREFRGLSRRQLEKSDFIEAFMIARKLESENPRLLRAIGWYSKGKITENTFDKFLAFWNVIEILGKEYHTSTARTEIGIKNKIYQCFLDYFGDTQNWNLPNGWIDTMYEKRNEVVHGGQDVTAEAIKQFSELVPLLEETSFKLTMKIFNSLHRREDFQYFDF